MSRLDATGLNQLWQRVSDVFARKAEAAKSLTLSNTTLNLSAVNGDNLSTVSLGSTFATNDYVQNNCITSTGITYEPSTGLITIHFYNALAVEVDSVSFTVS